MSAINERSLNVVWWILRVKIFEDKKGILLPDTVSWHLPCFTFLESPRISLPCVHDVSGIRTWGVGEGEGLRTPCSLKSDGHEGWGRAWSLVLPTQQGEDHLASGSQA